MFVKTDGWPIDRVSDSVSLRWPQNSISHKFSVMLNRGHTLRTDALEPLLRLSVIIPNLQRGNWSSESNAFVSSKFRFSKLLSLCSCHCTIWIFANLSLYSISLGIQISPYWSIVAVQYYRLQVYNIIYYRYAILYVTCIQQSDSQFLKSMFHL